jgi:hypothetical protein
MDWQQPVSLAIVAFTGYLFVRYEIRSRRKSRSRPCGSDCGCGDGDEGRPVTEISRTKGGNEEIAGPGRDTVRPPAY